MTARLYVVLVPCTSATIISRRIFTPSLRAEKCGTNCAASDVQAGVARGEKQQCVAVVSNQINTPPPSILMLKLS